MEPPRVFVDAEEDYFRWLTEHPRGFVVNTRRTADPKYLQLHRASCPFIASRDQLPGAYTERDYIKVCADSREPLDRWAREVGGALAWRCPSCR